ncbi:MAG: hypothetical protein SO062_07465, partial [Sodaliphilus sp.]|nr:hypothetical protein [Sodaliphilus sp.]
LERCSHIAEVKGSNPFVSTTKKGNHPRFPFFYFTPHPLLRVITSVEKSWGLNQKQKKQPIGDACASHLSLVLWHV